VKLAQKTEKSGLIAIFATHLCLTVVLQTHLDFDAKPASPAFPQMTANADDVSGFGVKEVVGAIHVFLFLCVKTRATKFVRFKASFVLTQAR
jgi:hypothetical protein